MVIIKVHKKDGKIIAAVCDTELLGKKFEEGELQLDLTGDFYKGEEKNSDDASDMIRNADHVNLVGKESVKLGIQEGIIEEQNVKTIQGIPYAQAIVVHEA